MSIQQLINGVRRRLQSQDRINLAGILIFPAVVLLLVGLVIYFSAIPKLYLLIAAAFALVAALPFIEQALPLFRSASATDAAAELDRLTKAKERFSSLRMADL